MHERPATDAILTAPGPTQPKGDNISTRQDSQSQKAGGDATRQAATAQYIAAMSGEMADLATGVGLKLVAHLLAMAQAEAEDAADRAA